MHFLLFQAYEEAVRRLRLEAEDRRSPDAARDADRLSGIAVDMPA